jgi:hypothetical protein
MTPGPVFKAARAGDPGRHGVRAADRADEEHTARAPGWTGPEPPRRAGPSDRARTRILHIDHVETASPAARGTSPPPLAKVRRPSRTLAREIRKEPEFRALLLALLAARLARPACETCRVDLECWPGVPYHRHMLWKVALYAGMRLVPYQGGGPAGGAGRPRLRLLWPEVPAAPEGASTRPPPPGEWWRGALNGASREPDKRTVERVFEATFGYGLAVDPTAHRGPCAAKSNRGSAHDGRVIDCPIPEADPALAYELLVDNRTPGGDAVLDLRVPVIGGEVPFVYLKRRPLGARFSNTNSAVALAAPEDVLLDGELGRLGVFCRAMGLDLGELDVLRDRGSGRVYVVDANRPAWGPPRPLRTADAVRAVRAYAAAFARLAARAAAADEGRGRSP